MSGHAINAEDFAQLRGNYQAEIENLHLKPGGTAVLQTSVGTIGVLRTNPDTLPTGQYDVLVRALVYQCAWELRDSCDDGVTAMEAVCKPTRKQAQMAAYQEFSMLYGILSQLPELGCYHVPVQLVRANAFHPHHTGEYFKWIENGSGRPDKTRMFALEQEYNIARKLLH